MIEQMIEEMKRYKTELFLTIANTGDELKDAKYVGASYAIDNCIEIVEKYKVKEHKSINEDDSIKFYYCKSEDKYYIGQRLGNFYYADVITYPNGEVNLCYGMSRYLPWERDGYPSEPKEITFEEWLSAFLKRYKAKELKQELKWISVDERLPKFPILAVDKFNQIWIPKCGVVRVVEENGKKRAFDGDNYDFGSFEEFMKGKVVRKGIRVPPREIIAWMPLPEYEEGGAE